MEVFIFGIGDTMITRVYVCVCVIGAWFLLSSATVVVCTRVCVCEFAVASEEKLHNIILISLSLEAGRVGCGVVPSECFVWCLHPSLPPRTDIFPCATR